MDFEVGQQDIEQQPRNDCRDECCLESNRKRWCFVGKELLWTGHGGRGCRTSYQRIPRSKDQGESRSETSYRLGGGLPVPLYSQETRGPDLPNGTLIYRVTTGQSLLPPPYYERVLDYGEGTTWLKGRWRSRTGKIAGRSEGE